MKRIGLVIAFVVSWVYIVAGAPEPVSAPAAGVAVFDSSAIVDTTLSFSLVLGSRLFPGWHETQDVRLGQDFYLGDSPYSAKVTAFMPDFGLIGGKARNFSRELGNPAVRVFVYADSGAVDSTWAFLNFPPHYSPKSFFTFQLAEVRGYGKGGPAAPDRPKKQEN
jgi:hypothetical protein